MSFRRIFSSGGNPISIVRQGSKIIQKPYEVNPVLTSIAIVDVSRVCIILAGNYIGNVRNDDQPGFELSTKISDRQEVIAMTRHQITSDGMYYETDCSHTQNKSGALVFQAFYNALGLGRIWGNAQGVLIPSGFYTKRLEVEFRTPAVTNLTLNSVMIHLSVRYGNQPLRRVNVQTAIDRVTANIPINQSQIQANGDLDLLITNNFFANREGSVNFFIQVQDNNNVFGGDGHTYTWDRGGVDITISPKTQTINRSSGLDAIYNIAVEDAEISEVIISLSQAWAEFRISGNRLTITTLSTNTSQNNRSLTITASVMGVSDTAVLIQRGTPITPPSVTAPVINNIFPSLISLPNTVGARGNANTSINFGNDDPTNISVKVDFTGTGSNHFDVEYLVSTGNIQAEVVALNPSSTTKLTSQYTLTVANSIGSDTATFSVEQAIATEEPEVPSMLINPTILNLSSPDATSFIFYVSIGAYGTVNRSNHEFDTSLTLGNISNLILSEATTQEREDSGDSLFYTYVIKGNINANTGERQRNIGMRLRVRNDVGWSMWEDFEIRQIGQPTLPTTLTVTDYPSGTVVKQDGRQYSLIVDWNDTNTYTFTFAVTNAELSDVRIDDRTPFAWTTWTLSGNTLSLMLVSENMGKQRNDGLWLTIHGNQLVAFDITQKQRPLTISPASWQPTHLAADKEFTINLSGRDRSNITRRIIVSWLSLSSIDTDNQFTASVTENESTSERATKIVIGDSTGHQIEVPVRQAGVDIVASVSPNNIFIVWLPNTDLTYTFTITSNDLTALTLSLDETIQGFPGVSISISRLNTRTGQFVLTISTGSTISITSALGSGINILNSKTNQILTSILIDWFLP